MQILINNIDDKLIKSFDKIKKQKKLLNSEFKFIDDLINDFSNYVCRTTNAVIMGYIKHLKVNPQTISLQPKEEAFKSFSCLIKKHFSKQNEQHKVFKDVLAKSLFEELQPYVNHVKGYIGNLQAWELDIPIKINGKLVIDPTTKMPLTPRQLNLLTKDIYNYLDSSWKGLAEEFAVKSTLLGSILKQMEIEGISVEQQKQISLREVYDRFGTLPKTIKEAKKRFDIDQHVENSIAYTQSNIGEYLSVPDGDYANKLVKIVKNQTNYALQNGLSNEQLASNLYHATKEELNKNPYEDDSFKAFTRDFRRVAQTEMNTATNNGYLASYSDDVAKGKDRYFAYAGRYNPQEKSDEICNCFLGEIVKLVTVEEAGKLDGDRLVGDPYAKRAIWYGKNRYGKGKQCVWIALPSHPNCTHYWSLINPEREVYDKKYGIVLPKKR